MTKYIFLVLFLTLPLFGEYIGAPGSPTWRPPVANFAALPATGNSTGDVRVTNNNQQIYTWSGSAWVSSGGGGGFTPADLTTSTTGVTVGGGSSSVNGAGTTVDIQTASGSQPGLLAAADWTTFNNKQSTISFGNLTDAGTDGITVTSGTGAVKGAGTSFAQQKSDGTHNGYLAQADWTTFNNKQSTLTLGNLTDAGTDGITVTAGTGAVVGSGTSFAQHVADASHNGYLSSADWTTFSSGGVSIGNLDAQAENAKGLAFVAGVLSAQSADATHPGMVNNTTQTLSGAKTLSTSVTSPMFISSTASPATSGQVRLANQDFIAFFGGGGTDMVIGPDAGNNGIQFRKGGISTPDDASFNYPTIGLGDINRGDSGLHVALSVLTSANQKGVYSYFYGNSAATGSINAFQASPGTLNGVTSAMMSGFNATDFSKGSGATVTRAAGFYLATGIPTVATNNCILCDNASWTGNVGINIAATGANTLGGTLQIADGSFAAPALSFTDATTTGISEANGTDLVLSANAIAEGLVNSSGYRVGADNSVQDGNDIAARTIRGGNKTGTTNATTGAGGQLTIQAGSATGSTSLGNGGHLVLAGGTSVGNNAGQVQFKTAGTLRAIVTGAIGNFALQTVGAGFQVKEGTNAKQGVVTLVGGTATVSNTSVTATSRIFLSAESLSGVSVPTALGITARSVGSSFTITSANVLDTSTVAWEIFEGS